MEKEEWFGQSFDDTFDGFEDSGSRLDDEELIDFVVVGAEQGIQTSRQLA